VPRAPRIISDMPVPLAKALLELGANLRLAREWHGLSIRALAAEINVSALAVVYAAALRFYGSLEWLPDLMAPEFDREGLHIELTGIRPRSVRGRWWPVALVQ
jgi:hypothetical protein